MSTTTQTVGAVRVAAPRIPVGGILAGVVLVAAGALLLWEAIGAIDENKALVGGPRLAPIVVSGGWLVIATLYLAQQLIAWRSAARVGEPVVAEDTVPVAVASDTAPAEQPAPTQEVVAARAWLTPALLIAALIAYIPLLEPVGFVLTTSVFFVAAARILRSTNLRRDFLVAVPLTLSVYFFFTRFLEIHLPEGVLPL